MTDATPVMVQRKGEAPVICLADLDELPHAAPLVSCIMATRGAIEPARHAIACFLAQTYRPRELVIVCTNEGSEVERYVAALAHGDIRFIVAPECSSVGPMRNAAIATAVGEFVCIWDDDDLSHPDRLRWQMAALLTTDAPAGMLSRVLIWRPREPRLAVSTERTWENTLVARRDILPDYGPSRRGSDTVLVETLMDAETIVFIDRPMGYCYIDHGGNLCSEEHFDMLFQTAQRQSAADDYDRDLLALSAVLPVEAYLRGLGALAATGGTLLAKR